MNKLYYGNGVCTIEGSDIRAVQIRYRGKVVIDDKTSDSFFVVASDDIILIVPIGNGILNELFNYEGELKIISVIVANNNAERVSTTIHRVMDYSELLNSNAEDLTTNSEDLSSTYKYGQKIPKTSIKKLHIENQHTSNRNSQLYLKDGIEYSGYFHIHITDGTMMTEETHSKSSQNLYTSKNIVEKPTKYKRKRRKIT